jgi:hypothetical protein
MTRFHWMVIRKFQLFPFKITFVSSNNDREIWSFAPFSLRYWIGIFSGNFSFGWFPFTEKQIKS